MTNEQYKGMLLDEMENWKRVLQSAKEEDAEKTAALAQAQIDKITEKMKF